VAVPAVANQGLEDAYAELQSTNEELETTNEELQSTNEELETMNEEMQSTNDELQTINDELAQRTAELHQLTEFLESIWAGLGGAVAVLDPDLRVLVWNHGFEELWVSVRQKSRASRSWTWTSDCPLTRSDRPSRRR
jgi:two-component system CheB/CheR fusion protein